MELDQEENVKICSVLVMDLFTKINIPDTFFITINFIVHENNVTELRPPFQGN